MVAYARINPTADADNGGNGDLTTGADITTALQYCASNYHTQGNIQVPPGTWEISDTVTFPYRSGGKFLAEGTIDPTISADKKGQGTVFQWTGADDGRPMFRFTGTNWEVGDFTCYASGYSNAVAIGWRYPPGSGGLGLGTGKSWHRPLRFVGFDICLNVGETTDPTGGSAGQEFNCDNLYFESLEALNCGTIMRMGHVFVLDIHVRKVHAGNCTYGFYVQGGGGLHVGHSLWTIGTQTALYIPADADTTWKTGKYHFDHVKVDDQSDNNWTFCKSYLQYNHSIVLNDFVYSQAAFDGNFAEIGGRCVLHINNGTSSFKTITGSVLDGVTPIVIFGNSFLQQDVSTILAGAIRYRVKNCTSWSNFWRDPDEIIAAGNK